MSVRPPRPRWRPGWCKMPSALSDATAPSASLDHLQARAAPTHPGAPPEHIGGSPRPQEPASGRPKVEESPLSYQQDIQVPYNAWRLVEKWPPPCRTTPPPPPPWTIRRLRPLLRSPERRLSILEVGRGLRSPPRAAPRLRILHFQPTFNRAGVEAPLRRERRRQCGGAAMAGGLHRARSPPDLPLISPSPPLMAGGLDLP